MSKENQENVAIMVLSKPMIRKTLLSCFILLSACTTTQPIPEPTPLPPPPPSARWMPKPGLKWQIQFAGALDLSPQVQAFDLDLFDTPQSSIDTLRARGVKIICYFSAGSSEDWRPDYPRFPSSVKGKDLDGWAGEKWLDVRKLDILVPIMAARMDLAVKKKCDAVDLDNMDGYTQDSGFTISGAEQVTYNKRMAKEAHARGLSIGLKNDLEQIKDLVNDYDFAINESCWDYGECAMLKPFVDRGKAVLGIEYIKPVSQFCTQANAMNLDFLKKNENLDAERVSCR